MGYMVGGAIMATLLWIFLGRANRRRDAVERDRLGQVGAAVHGHVGKEVEAFAQQNEKEGDDDDEERVRRLGDRHERYRYHV
jgi:hypothetical protein